MSWKDKVRMKFGIEPTEEPVDEEYFDRLGVEGEEQVATPSEEIRSHREDIYSTLRAQEAREAARRIDAQRSRLSSTDYLSSRSLGVEPSYGPFSMKSRGEYDHPSQRVIDTFIGSDRYSMVKPTTKRLEDHLLETESEAMKKTMIETVDRHMEIIIHEIQRKIHNIVHENGDYFRRGRSYDSERMFHKAIEAYIHGYMLRVQSFINVGYNIRIARSMASFEDILDIRLFTVVNGVERESVVNIPLKTYF